MSPEKTDKIVKDKEVIKFSRDVAEKAQIIVRDDKNLLPLSKDKKILVVEQCIPYEFLGKVSNRIINEVNGINRLTYDISSKPPATIEWE